jgi:hypothetical protein
VPVLTTGWVACSLHKTTSRFDTSVALRSSSSSTLLLKPLQGQLDPADRPLHDPRLSADHDTGRQLAQTRAREHAALEPTAPAITEDHCAELASPATATASISTSWPTLPRAAKPSSVSAQRAPRRPPDHVPGGHQVTAIT